MSFEEFMAYVQKVLQFPLFPIKDMMVTVASLLTLLGLMVVFLILARVLSRVVLTKVLSKTQLDEGLRYAASRIAHYLMMILGTIVAFQFIGIDLSGLLVVFGFLSVGIGFGLQNITSNFISGIILLLERPIKLGDRVSIGETEGIIEEINIRSTTVRSLKNISIIVPNSEFISASVVNWSHTDPKIRLEIDVGVSYSSDLDTVLACLRQVAEENDNVLNDPEPEVLLVSFGDSSWNMRLRAWIADAQTHNYMRSELNCAIVNKFRENGVEIPFPQRDLHLRSPIPLPHLIAGEGRK